MKPIYRACCLRILTQASHRMIFPVFYVLGVSIVFELVKAVIETWSGQESFSSTSEDIVYNIYIHNIYIVVKTIINYPFGNGLYHLSTYTYVIYCNIIYNTYARLWYIICPLHVISYVSVELGHDSMTPGKNLPQNLKPRSSDRNDGTGIKCTQHGRFGLAVWCIYMYIYIYIHNSQNMGISYRI